MPHPESINIIIGYICTPRSVHLSVSVLTNLHFFRMKGRKNMFFSSIFFLNEKDFNVHNYFVSTIVLRNLNFIQNERTKKHVFSSIFFLNEKEFNVHILFQQTKFIWNIASLEDQFHNTDFG